MLQHLRNYIDITAGRIVGVLVFNHIRQLFVRRNADYLLPVVVNAGNLRGKVGGQRVVNGTFGGQLYNSPQSCKAPYYWH